MNMISTGAFQTEMNASNKATSLAEKFAAVWEKKNAKAARAGGVSLMALSLAACGSSDDTTSSSTDTTDSTSDTTTVTPASQSFALTTGLDSAAGGAGDDSFSGSNTTLNAGDSVTGGEGADTLAVFSSAVATIGGFTSTGVETISVSSTSSTATDIVTLNLGSVSGETGLQVTGSSSSATFTNTDSIVPLTLSYNSAGNVVVTYNTSTVVGTADAMTVNTTDTTSGTVNIAGIETLTINNTGTSSVAALTTTSAAAVNVTGSGSLTLTNVDDATTALDMSAYTGTSSVNGLGAVDLTLTGGSGADTVIVAMANIDANDTITGGDGSDTLRIDDSMTSSAAMAGVTGFETVEIRLTGTGTSDDTVDGSILAGATVNVRVADSTDNSNAELVTISNAGSTQSVTMTDSTATEVADTNDGVSVTVTQKAGVGTSADVLNLTLSGETALAVTGNEYETLNIATAGSAASTVTTLSATTAQNINITGAKNLTLSGIDMEEQSATTVATLNAADFTGKLTATITNDEGDMTITGGSGNDSITLGTSSLDTDDVIDLGGGTDTLTITNTSGDLGEVNVEAERITLELTTGTATSVDLRNVETLARVTVDLDSTDENISVNNVKAGAEVILVDTTANNADVVTIDGATGSTSQVIKFSDVAGAADFNADLTASFDNLTLQTVDSLDDITIDAFSSATLDNLTLLGAGDITITTASNTTSLDVLSAGSVTGAITLTTLARAAGADITLGAGDDSINFITTSHAANTIAAGSGTDTIVITGSSTSNLVIDLSSATDQITNVSGAANTAAQTGFENVTASAVTTSAINVTGSSVANTIIGTAQADTIDGGAGADNITGKGGADNITSGTGRDTMVFESTPANNGVDTITDFTVGATGDKLNVLALDTTFATALKVATLAGAGGTFTSISTATATAADVDVLVLLDTTGFAAVANAEDEYTATTADVTDDDGLVVVYFDSASSTVKVAFDAAEGADSSGGVTVIAELSNLGSADLASFTADNFVIA